MDRKTARRSGRFAQFALAAPRQAIEDSGLVIDAAHPRRHRRRDRHLRATASTWAPSGTSSRRRAPTASTRSSSRRMGQHMGAARVGRDLGLRGPNTTVNTACASGTDALGHALNLLRLGHARAILAGGAEAMVTPLALSSMGRTGRALPQQRRPRARQPALRPQSRRVHPRRGRGRAGARDRGVRARPRRAHLLRARLASAGHSTPPMTPPPMPAARRRPCSAPSADADLTPAEVDYINCPRHQHAVQRPHRDAGDQARAGRRPRAAHRRCRPRSR